MRSRLRWAGALAVLTAAAAGCFPVVVHVDRQGRALVPRPEGVFILNLKTDRVEPLAKPAGGVPAWARWSPDETRVLVGEVLQEGDKRAALFVVDAKARKRSALGQFDVVSCALWAPDGKAVSVAEGGPADAVLKHVNLQPRRTRLLLKDTLVTHCWLPDGKLLAFRKKERVEPTNLYSGELVIVNPAGGEPKVVAPAACPTYAVFDVSPDGARALVIEAEVKQRDERPVTIRKLALVNLADGKKTALPLERPEAAFWSPDGKRILTLTRNSRLVVTDANGQNPTTIARGVAFTWDRAPVYPSWADGDTVLYFRAVRAEDGGRHALHLSSVKVDGTGQADLQATIDKAFAKPADQ